MGKKLSKTITANRVINTLKSREDEIRKYGVNKIGLFGSFASGNHNTAVVLVALTVDKPNHPKINTTKPPVNKKNSLLR